jgi:hypothetical protein
VFFSIIIVFSIIIDFSIFFNIIETDIDVFSIILLKKIYNEAVSIRIETTSGLKKFNPWTLRGYTHTHTYI